MTKDEALDLALEALEREEYRLRQTGQSQVYSGIGFAITAIKQARSAPVQKPYRPLQDNGSQYFGDSWDTLPAQPAPVQECLAHGECFGGKCIYTTPPAAQRQWVDLTNDEIALIHADNPHPQGFARAVLAKSKEKNNG